MHLKRLNRNEEKKIWDKCRTQGLKSVPQCRDLAPDHWPSTRQTATVPGGGKNWLHLCRGTLQEQTTGVKLELCTKIVNCTCVLYVNLNDYKPYNSLTT